METPDAFLARIGTMNRANNGAPISKSAHSGRAARCRTGVRRSGVGARLCEPQRLATALRVTDPRSGTAGSSRVTSGLGGASCPLCHPRNHPGPVSSAPRLSRYLNLASGRRQGTPYRVGRYHSASPTNRSPESSPDQVRCLKRSGPRIGSPGLNRWRTWPHHLCRPRRVGVGPQFGARDGWRLCRTALQFRADC